MNNTNENGGTDSNQAITELFAAHQEAIVIVLDPDDNDRSESKVGIFTKLASTNSRLATMLEQILMNLQSIRNGKSRSNSFENETTDTSQKCDSKEFKHSANCGKAICCSNNRVAYDKTNENNN